MALLSSYPPAARQYHSPRRPAPPHHPKKQVPKAAQTFAKPAKDAQTLPEIESKFNDSSTGAGRLIVSYQWLSVWCFAKKTEKSATTP
jgi:hypothetical protein